MVRRLAVRLYARLSGQIKARLEISNLKSVSTANFFNPFENKQTLTYDLKNTGNIELSADISAQSSGPIGLFAEEEGLRVSNLLPGNTRQVTQTVSGGGQFVVTNTSVIFTGIFTSEGIDAQQPRGRQDISSVTFPTATLLYIAFIAALVLGFGAIKRRRKSRSEDAGLSDS